MKSKKAQEEMVGFAIILIIVAVIMVVLLGFMLRKDNSKDIPKSSEVSAFIGAMLRYTSSCEDYLGFIEMQDLIDDCYQGNLCLDARTSCEALNSSIDTLMNSSWRVSENSPVKGYSFEIKVNDNTLLLKEQGNKTGSILSNRELFQKSGEDYQIYIKIYN